MSGARWRKVGADLLSNKRRSWLAVVSLAVGTTAVGAMFLAGGTVEDSFEATLADANPPSAVLVTDTFGPELVNEVARHPSVSHAEGRRLHQVTVTGAGGDEVTVELVAMTNFAANRTARISPESGAWPPPRGTVVLERAAVDELAADTDEVSVQRARGALVDLAVAGTAFDPYEVAPMLGGVARGYVAMETMAELTGDKDLNALYLRAASEPLDQDQAREMTTAVRDDVLRPSGVAIERSGVEDPAQHPADDALSFVTLAMLMLSILTLGIAIGLVVNTVAALLAQQRKQVGVMKAIGATSGQLSLQYLGYVLLLSLVAVVVSIPASLALGRFVAGFIADIANIELVPLGFPAATILLQVALATLLPIAAVVLAVRRATRTTVREAIDDRGLSGTAHARVDLPVTRPAKLAYRNAVRNPVRLGLTVLTVALSGAVVVGVLSTGTALGHLGDQVTGYSDYDVELALTTTVPHEDVDEVLADDPAVTSTEGWLRKQAFRVRPDGSENLDISLTGIPADSSLVTPTLLEGRWFDADDSRAIVINTHLADEEPDLTVGGSIRLEIEGQRRQWTIVGIATTTLVGPVAYAPSQAVGRAIGEDGTTNLVAVETAPGTDQADVAERIGAVARTAGLPVAGVQTNEEIASAVDGLFAIVVGLLLVVGAILAVVAVVGVAGTMTLGVFEQTREIGVLRTLGASTWAVRRLLLGQGMAVAALGGMLGVLLSIPVSLLLNEAIGANLISADLPTSFSWLGVGIWFAVVLMIGALGATSPSRVASRLTVRETLAYE
jgi:putative ABC transport system permease protein